MGRRCTHLFPMRILIFLTLLTIQTGFAQNKKILTSTSVGLLKNFGDIKGLGKSGFSTLTALEYNIHKKIWLTGKVDFQSIGYTRQLPGLEIVGRLNIVPVVVGGRYKFSDAWKVSPYVGAGAGLAMFSIPRGQLEGTTVRVTSETHFPFTYVFVLGTEWKFKPKFFPYLEINHQSFADDFGIFSARPTFVPLRAGFRTFLF